MRHLISTILLCILAVAKIAAQPQITATVQNMHIWRGDEVADGLVITTNASITDKSDHFTAGLWGGANIDGSYKEFNFYLSYHVKGLEITFVDTYNFSPAATYNNTEFFNYQPERTGRFLDANIIYDFESLPLKVQWATVIFGRDRGEINKHNKFSTFAYAECALYSVEKWHCDLGVGAAFALNNYDGGGNFYSDKAGVVDVTLRITYDLQIGDYTMPIFTRAMINPLSNSGFFQLGAQVISF